MSFMVLEPLNQLLSYLPAVFPAKKCTAQVSNSVASAGLEMSPFVRLAGLSGALAVSLGAYGSHVIRDDVAIDERRKKAFDTASRYHLIHTVALLGASRARYPSITGVAMLGGLLLFCGPCYHYSLTGNESTRRYTPIGGVLFILGWLTFII